MYLYTLTHDRMPHRLLRLEQIQLVLDESRDLRYKLYLFRLILMRVSFSILSQSFVTFEWIQSILWSVEKNKLNERSFLEFPVSMAHGN